MQTNIDAFANLQLVHHADERQIHGDEGLIAHRKRRLTASCQYAKVSWAGFDDVGCHLDGAHGIEPLVERLDQLKLNALDPIDLDGANRAAEDPSEEHASERPTGRGRAG
jgi:hypothetical protein